jgi:hypothetical protein
MAALSVAYHGTDPAVCRAFAGALQQLPPERAAKYNEYAFDLSPLAVQKILEGIMSSTTWPVHSLFAKEHFGRGLVEGEAKGEADAVVRVLEARGLAVSSDERERIAGCTDLKQLQEWVTRAVTVEHASNLFD